MRYFLTGLGLFILLSLFVRTWYVNTNKAKEIALNQSPITQYEEDDEVPIDTFVGAIMLEENLLLKSFDYEEIEKVVKMMEFDTSASLQIYVADQLDKVKVENTLATILSDQGILATRFRFLRKPSEITNDFQVLFQLK